MSTCDATALSGTVYRLPGKMEVSEFIVLAAAVLAIPSTSWTDGMDTDTDGMDTAGMDTAGTLSWTVETTFLLISCTCADAFLTVSLMEEVVLAMREGALPETDFMEEVVLARIDLVLDRPDTKNLLELELELGVPVGGV